MNASPVPPPTPDDFSQSFGLLSWLSGAFVAIISSVATGAAFVAGTRARLEAHEARIANLESDLREEARRLSDKLDEHHRQTMAMLLEIKCG
jgi:hypothetical protein